MASKAIGFLNFKFGADLKGFDRAMKKAQKSLKRFGKNIQKTGKTLSTNLTLPIVGLGIASVKAFDEQAKAIAQVEAGLKSTAGTVGFTSKELQKMASDLQKTTLFGDEEILKGATAQLLTFTNITGEQFAKTQEIALDLATRLDGDLKGASIMLGKALNDPVANLSALSRAGIQFSTDQKSVIKSLVETGDLASAQTIILEELEKQYGGSAQAAAEAGMGPITQLKNQLMDLSEQIGERLIPYIKRFVGWIVKLAERFDSLSSYQKDSIVFWGLLFAAIGPVLIIIGKMSIGISALFPLLTKLGTLIIANPYIALAAAIVGIGLALKSYSKAMSGVLDKKQALKNIDREAASSISTELSTLQRLVSVYDSQNTTLKDKKKALKTLKDLYPKYYSAIDETTFSSGKLKQATDQLTGSLMQKARLVAYSEGIEKVTASIVDLELKGKTTEKMWWETLLGKKRSPGGDLMRDFYSAMDEGNLEQNKKLLKLYTEEFEKLSKELGTDVLPDIKKVNHNLENQETIIGDLLVTSEDWTQNQSAIAEAPIIWDSVAQSMSDAADQFKGIVVWQTKISDSQKLMNAGYMMFGDVLSSSLESALGSQEDFFKVFIANIKKAIRSLLIQLAVMTLINALMGGGKAAFSIASITSNLGKIMNVQGFAEGGLVTGPTTALIGEGIGTTASNPEVVAPLDRLKQFMNGGDQNIVVTGKLIGNDIYLSNQNAGINRKRTV